MFPDSVHRIYGHISPAEMELLFNLAAAVPQHGVIVEIGSFQGKSTVCLGLGAKQAGAQVYAIDPHENEQINERTHYGMENHAALLKNLVDFEVGETVRVIALPSQSVVDVWNCNIDLLWIDGSHEYQAIRADLISWSPHVGCKIAVHDSSGHFPAVTQALTEFVMDNDWKITSRVDATSVLERIR